MLFQEFIKYNHDDPPHRFRIPDYDHLSQHPHLHTSILSSQTLGEKTVLPSNKSTHPSCNAICWKPKCNLSKTQELTMVSMDFVPYTFTSKIAYVVAPAGSFPLNE